MGELERRNLSSIVAMYFLHDDVVTNNQATGDAVEWLSKHAPHIVPQTNTGNQGYETLYTTRQPIFAPEEYSIDGTTTNATAATESELALFASNRYVADRYRWEPWPTYPNPNPNPNR